MLFLANTGVRHGTEALGLKWRNIEWYLRDGARHLAVNVDGKTNKRTAIARDRVVDFLWRQAQLNPRIEAVEFNSLISAKSDQLVFVTLLSKRWSQNFGPVVKVDRMKKVTIQNEETKEPFAGIQSQGCA